MSPQKFQAWCLAQLLLMTGPVFGESLKAEAPAPEPPKRARVTSAYDPQCVRMLFPSPERAQNLFNSALLKYTGTSDIGSAWKKIVSPTDRIGIKIQTSPGPVMSSRSVIVDAIIAGLKKSGVSAEKIIIFDRYATQMENAGYKTETRGDGVLVQAIVPESGYDRGSEWDAAVPGKLIWGDLDFKNNENENEDQISTKSHLANTLTQKVDKVINVAVPITDPDFGIYACRLGNSLSMTDNFRRFQRARSLRDDMLTELFSNPVIQKKSVLHVLDGLVLQYAGGPGFDPDYCSELQTIYIGNDPVALDALLLEEINQKRSAKKMVLIKEEASYLKAAEDAGLGVADPARIDIETTVIK